MNQFAFEVTLHEEDDRIVYAQLAPCFGHKELTRTDILALLDSSGYADLYRLENKLSELLEADRELAKQCRQLLKDVAQNRHADQNGQVEDEEAVSDEENQSESLHILEEMGMEYPRFPIAERRDAKVLIETDEADLHAYLGLLPPCGGNPADQKAVTNAIRQAGVKFGLIQEAVTTAVKRFDTEKTPVLIAKGKKPVKGKNSDFEHLVESVVCHGPQEDSRGKLNYLDVNEFVLVEPGTPLMRRTQPGPGISGVDVFGRPVPAESGDILPFSSKVEGAKVSDNDPDLLIAIQKGHPIVFKTGVTVDPALELKNVSLATGNIDYDGSVHVREDVADGMTVKASGNVIVNGVVGKATVIAGGDIIIDQGLIGGGHSEEGKTNHSFGAKIYSKGNVSARFITCAQIKAGGSVMAQEYISHSDIDATDSVLLGQKRGNGQLIGGETRAFNKVAAKTLGTKAYVPTAIRVGADPDTLPRLRSTMKNLKQLRNKVYEINVTLNTFSTRGRRTTLTDRQKELVSRYKKQQQDLNNEVAAVMSEKRALQSLLVKSKASTVTASKAIYSNVKVNILHTGKRVTEDMGRGTFRFSARHTVIERQPLKGSH